MMACRKVVSEPIEAMKANEEAVYAEKFVARLYL